MRRFFTLSYTINLNCDKSIYLDGLLQENKFSLLPPFKTILHKIVNEIELEPRNIEKLLYIFNSAIAFEGKIFSHQSDLNQKVLSNWNITWGDLQYVYLLFLTLKLKNSAAFDMLIVIINKTEQQVNNNAFSNPYSSNSAISNLFGAYPLVNAHLLSEFFRQNVKINPQIPNANTLGGLANQFKSPKPVNGHTTAASLITDSINKLDFI